MRTTATTLLITLLLIVLNIGNSFAKNQEDIFRNEVMDKETNTQTVTLCKNSNGALTPLKMYTVQYNNENAPVEKVMYKYNERKSDWTPTQKYIYTYDDNGQMLKLSLSNWDKSSKDWKEQEASATTIEEIPN